MREICEGRSGLPRATENAYRARWGLPPLPAESSESVAAIKTRTVTVSTRGAMTETPASSLMARVWNFSKALVKHVADGGRKRTKKEVRQIVSICEACPFYDHARLLCLRCGCNCSGKNEFLNKITWRSERCPDARW
jgi:hypothetical protein